MVIPGRGVHASQVAEDWGFLIVYLLSHSDCFKFLWPFLATISIKMYVLSSHSESVPELTLLIAVLPIRWPRRYDTTKINWSTIGGEGRAPIVVKQKNAQGVVVNKPVTSAVLGKGEPGQDIFAGEPVKEIKSDTSVVDRERTPEELE